MVSGQTNDFQWDYSEQSDILNIHKTGKKVAGGTELGDFTVDFDNEGNVVGLEIMNVSDFLKEVGIESTQLRQLGGAELQVTSKVNLHYLWIKLILPGQVEKVIPIPAPVLAEVAA